MPIFEFLCKECGGSFEELLRSASATESVICPLCGSDQIKKQISTFASKVAGGSSPGSFSNASSSGCSSGGSV
jgi:putative FmdB family regulatory protein